MFVNHSQRKKSINETLNIMSAFIVYLMPRCYSDDSTYTKETLNKYNKKEEIFIQ